MTTDDGYILTMHRIFGKKIGKAKYENTKDKKPKEKKKIIYIQHGFLSSSAEWVLMGPGKCLGFVLADQGYDVWLGNVRGSTYSKSHTHLEIDSKEFWDFSWHEMALNDIPKMIDHILETTGQDKLFHVGFSQGSTTLLILCSLKPEYNKKIIAHFSLAPVAFFDHVNSKTMRFCSYLNGPIHATLDFFGKREILPLINKTKKLGKILNGCKPIRNLLISIASLFIDLNMKQVNMSEVPLHLGHVPAGSSLKQCIHFLQLMDSGWAK